MLSCRNVFVSLFFITLASDVGLPAAASSPVIAASSNEVWCGIFGPSSAKISCDPSLDAHCWCDPAVLGLWGVAKCACEARAPPTAPVPAHLRCSIPFRPGLGCPEAGVLNVTDPGCSVTCNEGLPDQVRCGTYGEPPLAVPAEFRHEKREYSDYDKGTLVRK